MSLGTCCFTGFKHEGQPTGETKLVENVEVYFSYPKSRSTENAILFMTDIFGSKLVNNTLLADQFASQGYLVVIPDLFNKNPVPFPRPDSFAFTEWLEEYAPEKTLPIAQKVVKYLRNELGTKKIASVGYCYGAKLVVLNMQAENNIIDAGFIAHPALVRPTELGSIRGPLSLSVGYDDMTLSTKERHESEKELVKSKQPFEITVFSGVDHGFAIRGDLNDKQVKYAKEAAFYQAVRWFDNWI